MLRKILLIIGMVIFTIVFAMMWKVRYHKIKEEEEGQR